MLLMKKKSTVFSFFFFTYWDGVIEIKGRPTRIFYEYFYCPSFLVKDFKMTQNEAIKVLYDIKQNESSNGTPTNFLCKPSVRQNAVQTTIPNYLGQWHRRILWSASSPELMNESQWCIVSRNRGHPGNGKIAISISNVCGNVCLDTPKYGQKPLRCR